MSRNINLQTSKRIRLDEFLRLELPKSLGQLEITGEISNSKIRRLIVSGSVYVNGKAIVRPAFELRGTSHIQVSFDENKFFFEKQPDDIQFTVTQDAVLYEDENLIFIDKPSFFPVEQTIVGNRANLHDAVVDFLWKRNPELRNPPYVGIMHRLDRETSGVILFTKNRSINKAVSDMFQSHNFTKRYLTIVTESNNSKKHLEIGQKFTVEKYMGRISGKSQAGKWGQLPESKGGQYSKTDFKVVDNIVVEGKNCFLIQCDLFTGRTHQIRVHLSEAGYPVLGDELYGGQPGKRIYLHAWELSCCSELLDFNVKSPFNY